jgi:hypothetical protein
MTTTPDTPDYMQSFDTYWRDIVCDPDGSLNLDKVARELADALTLQNSLTEVYSAVSNGAVSKPFTLPSVVIGLHEEACMREADEAVADLIEEIGDDDDALLRTPQEVAAWIRTLRPAAAVIETQRAAERAEAEQS